MGFFDFIKSKAEPKYEDFISNENWESELNKLYLTNELQSMMYDGVRQMQMASKSLMSNQTNENIQIMIKTVVSVMHKCKEVENWLFAKRIHELKSEHLVAAFYLVNLSDTTSRDIASFSDNEIKNTFATNLHALGYSNIQPDELPKISADKVRKAARWLFNHPAS